MDTSKTDNDLLEKGASLGSNNSLDISPLQEFVSPNPFVTEEEEEKSSVLDKIKYASGAVGNFIIDDMLSKDVAKAIPRAALGVVEESSQLLRTATEDFGKFGISMSMGLGGSSPVNSMSTEDAKEHYAKLDYLKSKEGSREFELAKKDNPLLHFEHKIGKIKKDTIFKVK